jgi:hypothetical protein
LDLIESLIKGILGIQIQKADLGMAIYNRQNVIKIMGNSSRKPSYCFHLLSMHQLFLCSFCLSYILTGENILILQQHGGEGDELLSPIFACYSKDAVFFDRENGLLHPQTMPLKPLFFSQGQDIPFFSIDATPNGTFSKSTENFSFSFCNSFSAFFFSVISSYTATIFLSLKDRIDYGSNFLVFLISPVKDSPTFTYELFRIISKNGSHPLVGKGDDPIP